MPKLPLRLLPFALLVTGLVACAAPTAEETPAATDEALSAKKLAVFDCKTETKVDEKLQRIQFSVRNIGDSKKVEVLTPEGKEDEDEFSPIKTTPKEGRVAALNENIGVSSGTRTLRISGDSDGFFLIELVLFKNTNYANGFLRIFGSEDDGPHQFSKVHCAVTQ